MILFILVLLCMTSSEGARILLMPMDHGSHVNLLCSAGKTLKDAGHNVYVIVSTNHLSVAEKYNLTTIVPEYKTLPDVIGEEVAEKGNNNMIDLFRMQLGVFKNQTRELFSDEKTMEKLEILKFDLAIMDGFDLARYLYVVPYKLSVPFISITPRPDPWTARVPALPSIEGMMPLYIFNEDNTIIQRFLNMLSYIFVSLLVPPSPFTPIDDNFISELVPERLNIGFGELYKQSQMILVNMDTVCLDFPRISSPYYQYIGGLGAQPAKSLSNEFNAIASGAAKHGLIVLSFGSGIKTIPRHILVNFLEGFREVKQTVIMRHAEDKDSQLPSNEIPPNVHIRSWLPQNDLLGHPNTRLFITHGGNNGQLEATYHGIPMLTFPMFGDQYYNARRVEKHEYGIQLDPKTFTSAEFRDTVIELVENKKYYNKIKKCSKILHSLPSPQERVLFWVEHVLEFGAEHLRPFYLDMPLWKVCMLDVVLLGVVIVLWLVCSCRWCCNKICYKVRGQKSGHMKED